jgi:hypothetical protein
MRHASPERRGWIYRARIVTTYTAPDGSVTRHETARGPYSRKADATRAVTRESHGPRPWGDTTRETTGRVEMSAVIWIPAE